VQFQSSDAAIGIIVPPRIERYTVTFGEDGRAAFQLDCNRAVAGWSAEPASGGGGTIRFSPGAMTRAACGPGAIDSRIASDLQRLRSYSVTEGRLLLALEADGGTYLWDPAVDAGR
jgi:heat shock protein HslJ